MRTESRYLVSGILVFYIKENNLKHSRLGLAISKKLGNAIKRNKTKRKLREVFRSSEIKNLNIDILVSLNFRKIQKEKLDFDSVTNLLEESFLKAPLLK